MVQYATVYNLLLIMLLVTFIPSFLLPQFQLVLFGCQTKFPHRKILNELKKIKKIKKLKTKKTKKIKNYKIRV